MKRLALITFFLLALLEICTSLTCLQCDGITHPRHCRYVADCFEGEVCAVETVKNSFGQHLYKVGCVMPRQCLNSSEQSDKCHECCNTNLCNSQGCGESGYPIERGPICYHCPAQVDVHTCNTIEFCETGEMCYYMERAEFGDMVYTGRCTSKHLCTASGFLGNVIVGRDLFSKTYQQSRSLKDTRCEGCCGFDLCNKGCNISSLDNCHSSPCLRGQCVDTTEGFTCVCPAGVTGVWCEIARASDCYDIQHMGLGSSNGVYTITLWRTNRTIQVLCDLTTDGGGWTVFQNRFDGSVDFYRNFTNYTSGFGNLTGEFWLGLDIIHEITTQKLTELRIDLTDANERKLYGVFKTFSISEGPGYVLHNLRGTGTLADQSNGLSYHTGQSFSTFDHDKDSYDQDNCAVMYHGGWWFNGCLGSDLNGIYFSPGTINSSSMSYFDYKTSYESLKTSTMMFRAQK